VPAFFVLMDDLSRFLRLGVRALRRADRRAGGRVRDRRRPLDDHVVPYPARPTKIAAE
jgi:hypothetical protein